MSITRRVFAFAAVAAIAGFASVASGVATAPDALARKPQINTIGSPGIAIKGFDPVAYFTVGKPVKGSNAFETEYKGATWRFSSAENKAAFEANPAKYEPAQGYLVKIEGNAWAIRDGKLYLNYDTGVQRRWAKKPASYIATANKKWPGLVGKK